MEGNKDDSEKCLRVAEKFLRAGEKEKALKFLNKAERLYPSKRAKDLLAQLHTANGSAASGGDDSSGASASANSASSSAPEAASAEGETGPRQRRAGSSSNATPPPTVERNYTQEQLDLVRKVRKSKDYYEILGVNKEFNEDDLKKSYRKMALKLHPDKNQAPGAAEAFKAVGNAYSVLSNPEKRQRYDQFGSEAESSRRSHHHYHDNDYSRGFEGDISAEELFNMFFGGGFPSGRVYTRRTNRTHFHHHNGGAGGSQTEPTYTLLLQLAPILFLVFLSLISSFLVSEPVYSLQKTDRYIFQRKTEHLRVPYFVKSDFHTEFKGSMRKLEQQVEDDYVSNLRANCFKERSYKENMLWRARNFNDARLYEKASNLKTPSCDTLQSLYS